MMIGSVSSLLVTLLLTQQNLLELVQARVDLGGFFLKHVTLPEMNARAEVSIRELRDVSSEYVDGAGNMMSDSDCRKPHAGHDVISRRMNEPLLTR